jgi:hypothetical protein
MNEAIGPGSSIRLPSIDCDLPLPEVYDHVTFPPQEEETEADVEAGD